MKLVTFSTSDRSEPRLGAIVGDSVVDLAAAAPDLPDLFSSLGGLRGAAAAP